MSDRQLLIDPDDELDYGREWADWLASDKVAGWEAGDPTIVTSTWAITPIGPTLADDSSDDTETVVWVSGCVAGTTYTLTNSIIDSDGRKADRSITLVCQER